MITIETSVDWQEARRRLEAQTRGLDYNPQYGQLLANIDRMVTELGRQEVEARRLRRPQMVSEHLLKVNEAIAFYERAVFFNKLAF